MKRIFMIAALCAAGMSAQEGAELFHLRSECTALAKELEQSMGDSLPRGRNSLNSYTQTSHYDPQANRCYVRISTLRIGKYKKLAYVSHDDSLYDGQTRQRVANASSETRSEKGHTETTERGSTPTMAASTRGHDSYIEAQAFIAARMVDR
jgi:hypothetical protein